MDYLFYEFDLIVISHIRHRNKSLAMTTFLHAAVVRINAGK